MAIIHTKLLHVYQCFEFAIRYSKLIGQPERNLARRSIGSADFRSDDWRNCSAEIAKSTFP